MEQNQVRDLPRVPEMAEVHFLAMKAYADKHGRKWKERLTQAWLNDWREQWGELRAIRNHPEYHAGNGLIGIFETFERQCKSQVASSGIGK